MKAIKSVYKQWLIGVAAVTAGAFPGVGLAADHNDPNAINSIFADISLSGADLYDLFGFPADDKTGGEKVVVALTFAPVPKTGVFDTDLLYRINLDPDPRIASGLKDESNWQAFVDYVESVKDKYLKQKAAEIRVTFNKKNQAKVNFSDFPGGGFSKVIDTNKVETIESPDKQSIKAYIGGRDDAFFNDLPGFFRSINYAPQYYRVAHLLKSKRELEIPKTFLELEGNVLFNYDKNLPEWGITVKKDLPPGRLTWTGKRFLKDAQGSYRFVYSGKDAQAGKDVNAIVFELPLRFVTTTPERERIVRTWGESWVLKAANKIGVIPPDKRGIPTPFLARHGRGPRLRQASMTTAGFNDDIARYKRVDVDGVPFLDAALNEREDERQLADNVKLARHYVVRFAHLGWGFGPSVSALGLGTCFNHDNSPVSVHKTYTLAVTAFPRVKRCFLQRVNMPDNSWNKSGLDIKSPRTFEIFVPNVAPIDMDTTGTWPFGRRLEDQVATRFLALFLDMETGCGAKKCNLETLGDPALWEKAPILPKTPPNPLKNDKEFLKQFPYLAEPWHNEYR